jgi:Leucine-rich repeat (LRR) protein
MSNGQIASWKARGLDALTEMGTPIGILRADSFLPFGSHQGDPSLQDLSSPILRQYGPPRDLANLGHPEAPKSQESIRAQYISSASLVAQTYDSIMSRIKDPDIKELKKSAVENLAEINKICKRKLDANCLIFFAALKEQQFNNFNPDLLPQLIEDVAIDAKTIREWMKNHPVILNRVPRLDLTDKNLTLFPPEILQLSKLTTLNIDNNLIGKIPTTLSRLSKLQWLRANNAQLESYPEVNLPKLEYLDIAQNLFTEIPKNTHKKYPNLIRLSLQGCPIKGLSKDFRQLHLNALNIRDTQVEELPDWFVMPPVFDCDETLLINFRRRRDLNILRFFAAVTVQHLSANTFLNLELPIPSTASGTDREIRENAREVRIWTVANRGALMQIKTLDLRNLGLTAISGVLTRDFRALEKIDLSGNPLKEISTKNLCTFISLKWLSLRNTELESWPEALELPLLSTLDIADNPFREPPVIQPQKFPSLKRLVLNGEELVGQKRPRESDS